MQPMPSKNTSLKRRLIRETDEEELEVEIEEQQVVNHLNGIQLTSMATLSEEAPKRARRAAEASVHAAQAGPSITLNEFYLAVEALPRKVRASTAMIYRIPLEHRKNFCEKNRNRYPVDSLYPYTVDPTEFFVAFFKGFLFKRIYKKSVHATH
ncbi:hypothetical protein INT46_007408 [Mucor plumbeus]|uniref:Uncharacterized protein n=1 Tax=Mucor plumbeus TaxID=97098 RepID=A0A8H7QBS5_9FUNG|nr:hypothetical protein INT46_007408 [Mucor plumbeus]